MVLTRIILLVLSASLLVTSYLAMKYYRDTKSNPGNYMRKFLYLSTLISIIILVSAGFQFIFALAIAVVLTPLIIWYMKNGRAPDKIQALYKKIPIPKLPY
jgi:hypothetical protein